MQPAGGMLLDDIGVPAAPATAAARLRRYAELPLFTVNFERHGTSIRALRRFPPHRASQIIKIFAAGHHGKTKAAPYPYMNRNGYVCNQRSMNPALRVAVPCPGPGQIAYSVQYGVNTAKFTCSGQ
jgi:hypothetical protein